MLRKILKIGLTNIMPSVVPIIIWSVLSFLYNNNVIAQGFSLTYPYQFIYMGLYAVTIRGQIKSEAKQHSIGDRSNSGVVMFLLFSAVIIITSYIFRRQILSFYNFNYIEHTPILMYGIIIIVCDYTIFCITLISQYKNKHKDALFVNLKWYSLRIVVAFIVGIFVKDYYRGMYILTGIEVIVLSMFLIKRVSWNKFGISFRDGIKYTMSELPHDVLMCLIYIFGYGKAASMAGGYFAAYNIEALCTDTQWDILDSGIDTTVTTEICDTGNNDIRKVKVAAVLYSIILFISSALMIAAHSFLYTNVDIGKVFLIFVIECAGFPIYALCYCEAGRIVINNPTPLIAILTIIRYIVRLAITSLIKSPYAISYGVVFSCVYNAFQWYIIYKYVNRKELGKCQQ